MTLNKDQVGRDKANKINKEKEEKKMNIMQERMEFIQKGIKELQEKAQVRIIPVLKTTPQAIQANIELVPESEKSLEECLAEYAFRKNEEKLEAEKAEKAAKEQEGKAGNPDDNTPDPKADIEQEKHPGLR
jgi:deoxyribodipyrimidine photolyase